MYLESPNVLKIFTFAEIYSRVVLHTDIAEIHTPGAVVTLGFFDGVHRGHRWLLSRLQEEASKRNVPSVVISFWPHPRLVLGSAGPDFQLLNTKEEKIRRIEDTGIDHLVLLTFTPEFSQIPAEVFVRDYLVASLKPSCLVVGDEVRFGARGEGTANYLEEVAAGYGYNLVRLDTRKHEEHRISSTFIRACLKSGDLASANHLLGYHYEIAGEVQPGNRIGSSIGFPTANIYVADPVKQIPADGVYAVMAESSNGSYGGMLNIGIRPTIEDHNRQTIEVHMFGAEGEWYGKSLTIRLVARLRDEMKFNNLDELRDQLFRDRENAIKAINL